MNCSDSPRRLDYVLLATWASAPCYKKFSSLDDRPGNNGFIYPLIFE